MWEVFLWIPSKGWKQVLRTKNRDKAIEMAMELEPLEVKLRPPMGRNYLGGHAWQPVPGDKYQVELDFFAAELAKEVQDTIHG